MAAVLHDPMPYPIQAAGREAQDQAATVKLFNIVTLRPALLPCPAGLILIKLNGYL